jgi:hypothetical protein
MNGFILRCKGLHLCEDGCRIESYLIQLINIACYFKYTAPIIIAGIMLCDITSATETASLNNLRLYQSREKSVSKWINCTDTLNRSLTFHLFGSPERYAIVNIFPYTVRTVRFGDDGSYSVNTLRFLRITVSRHVMR